MSNIGTSVSFRGMLILLLASSSSIAKTNAQDLYQYQNDFNSVSNNFFPSSFSSPGFPSSNPFSSSEPAAAAAAAPVLPSNTNLQPGSRQEPEGIETDFRFTDSFQGFGNFAPASSLRDSNDIGPTSTGFGNFAFGSPSSNGPTSTGFGSFNNNNNGPVATTGFGNVVPAAPAPAPSNDFFNEVDNNNVIFNDFNNNNNGNAFVNQIPQAPATQIPPVLPAVTDPQPQPQPQPPPAVQDSPASFPPLAQEGRQVTQCNQRNCDQVITGRDLSYQRALQIVQDEEYLTEADLDIIRRRRKRRRGKRSPLLYFTDGTFGSFTENESVTEQALATKLAFNDVNLISVLAPLLLGVTTALSLVPKANNTQQQQPPPPQELPIQIVEVVRPPEGEAPINVPQPGTPLGGGLPISDYSPTAGESLALVPAGLKAVSTFPPFATPRTLDSVCVIFSENDERSIAAYRAENRRSQSRRRYRQKRQVSMSRFRNMLMKPTGGIRKAMRKFFPQKKRNYRHQKDQRHSQPKSLWSRGGNGQQKKDYGYKIVERIIPRRYGFRCAVQLARQSCVLGETCDEFGNKCEGSCPAVNRRAGGPQRKLRRKFSSRRGSYKDVLTSRQTGQEFSSDAPPDCRTIFVPCT